MTSVYGDIPLAYLVALAALLLVLWLEEQQPWQLAVATIFLAGAMLTKREGILFTVCVLVATFAATWAERRLRWKPLLVTGLVAFALALPWRIWFVAHGLPGDGPTPGTWVRPPPRPGGRSFHLVVTTLFDRDLWPIVPAVAVAAIVLAAVAGSWRIRHTPPSSWARRSRCPPGPSGRMRLADHPGGRGEPDSPRDEHSDPRPRRARSSAPRASLVGAHRSPVRARRTGCETRSCLGLAGHGRWSRLGVLSHPGAMLLGYSGSGLPGGLPHFPSAADCVSAPVDGEPVRMVVGYADTYQEANGSRARPSCRTRRNQNRPGRLWSPSGVRRGHGVGSRLTRHAGRCSGGGSSSCARERRGPAMKTAVRVGIVACVTAACLMSAGRLDDALAVFDFRADTNDAATFNERTYP